MSSKPLASISLDLDNLWSYLKTHGDPDWKDFPSYFDICIPTIVDVLDRLELDITFFLVGQDAAMERHQDGFELIAERQHEIGNHTFHHEPWLRSYSKDQLRTEISRATEAIERVTRQKPIGFRGPGYSWSSDLFEVLVEQDYVYDTSTLPTYLNPLARLYFLWKSNLTREERSQRKELFGSFKDGMRSVKPYYWQLASGARLLEIPVTTVPIIKTPFHLSYLLYLSRFSEKLMRLYLKTAITMCRITKTEPSFILHSIDFLGAEQVPELRFLPGMDLSAGWKIESFEHVVNELAKHFTLVNMRSQAQSILQHDGMHTESLLAT